MLIINILLWMIVGFAGSMYAFNSIQRYQQRMTTSLYTVCPTKGETVMSVILSFGGFPTLIIMGLVGIFFEIKDRVYWLDEDIY